MNPLASRTRRAARPAANSSGVVGLPRGGEAAACLNLVKRYGADEAQVTALDSVSVAFDVGKLTAIMGPSGSGKSTLMHCAAGLDVPDAGEVWIGDTEIASLNERKRSIVRRERIGFVFQSFNLVPTLTAKENITLPLVLAGRDVDEQWFARVVETVGLGHRLDHRPSELSGGQQQRVAVARALVSKPQIVFADEPTGNLDSRTGAEILGFLRNSADQINQTIVMVTHDPVAAAFAHRVIFLADGRIEDQLEHPTADAVLSRMHRFAR